MVNAPALSNAPMLASPPEPVVSFLRLLSETWSCGVLLWQTTPAPSGFRLWPATGVPSAEVIPCRHPSPTIQALIDRLAANPAAPTHCVEGRSLVIALVADDGVVGACELERGQSASAWTPSEITAIAAFVRLGGLYLTQADRLTEGHVLQEHYKSEKIYKDRLFATLCHELRTPIGAIAGWVEILKRLDIDHPDLTAGLADIAVSTETLDRLIGDALQIVRAETRKIPLNFGRVDVNDVIFSAVTFVRHQIEAKRIILRLDLAYQLPPILADAERLKQVLWNLLENAIKHSAEGSQVAISSARRDDDIEIKVSDTGTGIPPGILPHIFDWFEQGKSGNTDSGGMGIGLAVAKALVEAHYGAIHALSHGLGLGSTFCVRLPIDPVHPDEITVVSA